MRNKKPVVNTTSNQKTSAKVEKSPLQVKWLVMALGFLLYLGSLGHQYALDDKIVITSNQITKGGWSQIFDHLFYDSMDGFWAEQYGVDVATLNKEALVAGGRYRPLSLITYSAEYALFGENPGISHFINALLYAILGGVLFQFLTGLFNSYKEEKIWKSIPFWVTVIFLTHPLHVEVVANIKSRDEILSLLFGLLALRAIVGYCASTSSKSLWAAGGYLFLSLMAKETTIAFVALGPLLLYFFSIGKKKQWLQSFYALFGAGVLYTLIRSLVIGSQTAPIASELMNDPFLNAEGTEWLATIFLVLAAYMKLLFFPYPLTHDYYPFHLPFLPEEMTYPTFSHPAAIAGVILLVVLLGVIVQGFKSKSIYAFSGLFFLGTAILVSNLFFPIGVFMNERFMFIPSIGFALALVYFMMHTLPQKMPKLKKSRSAILLGGIATVFALITVQRVPAWENDRTLALTDVSTSAGSAKANMAAGDALVREIEKEKNPTKKNELIEEAYIYLKKSLEIYPGYFPPLDLLGKVYYEAENYPESIKFFEYCAQRKPNNPNFRNNIFYIGNKLVQEQQYEQAGKAYDVALKYDSTSKAYLLAAAEVWARYLNNPSRGLPYVEKAYQYYPNDAEVTEKVGITYAMLGRVNDAIYVFEQLLKKNPQNASVMKNLGIVYYQAGNVEKGQELIAASEALLTK